MESLTYTTKLSVRDVYKNVDMDYLASCIPPGRGVKEFRPPKAGEAIITSTCYVSVVSHDFDECEPRLILGER